MAVSYVSSQTRAFSSVNNGDPITITKPSGVAVGDLLVAHLVSNGDPIGGAPSGWTQEFASEVGNVFSYLYSKVAVSADVSAVNYSWTNGAFTSQWGGSITRITGAKSTSPISVKSAQTSTTIPTPSYSNSVTPTLAESLLLFFVGYGASTGTNTVSASGYSITTSDPTWTEAYDINDAARLQMSMAYANRTAITATGNSSVTFANSATSTSHGIMLAIEPQLVVNVTESLAMVETTQKRISKTFTDNLDTDETVTKTKTRVWSTESKPNTTWTNNTL